MNFRLGHAFGVHLIQLVIVKETLNPAHIARLGQLLPLTAIIIYDSKQVYLLTVSIQKNLSLRLP